MSSGNILAESLDIFFTVISAPSVRWCVSARDAAEILAEPPQQPAGVRKEKNEKRLEISLRTDHGAVSAKK